MRTVEEHLAAILRVVGAADPVRVPLDDALGLVACEEVESRVDLPGFDNSAMDGYAVRAADVAPADPALPGTAVTLRVVADVAAGQVPRVPVGPGEAVRIMTGAMLPEGADTVVQVEDTDAGTATVTIHRAAPLGRSVRRRGEDLTVGGPVLLPGAVVGARTIALLAATGHGDLLVRPRPRVAVLSTGAELVAPGQPLDPGQIHDSNSHMLAACVTEAGAVAAYRGCVGDDPEQVMGLLTELAADADLIVTSGGVSMGAHDVVKEVLSRSGSVQFVQVAMQPGKPQGFGVLGERRVPIFGLPGNPVSSYVSFEIFVRPALRRMMGMEPLWRPLHRAVLTTPLRSPKGRRQIARATARWDDGRWWAAPVGGQGSHFVADLARADAFVIVPEDVVELEAGDQVDLVVLGSGEGIG